MDYLSTPAYLQKLHLHILQHSINLELLHKRKGATTMGAISDLEPKLNDIFFKKAPKLPENGKKAIVQYAPVLAIIIGVLQLLSAWTLFHWANYASSAINTANEICKTYGLSTCATNSIDSRFSLWLWISIIILAAQAIFYLLSYSGLKAHAKQGWNYLYYGALVNVAYAVFSLFTDYDKAGHFIGGLIGSAIGFYFLFQIRSYYLGKKVAGTSVTPKDSLIV